jgi:hypothetical protein
MPKLAKLRHIRKEEEEKILKEDEKTKDDFETYGEYRNYIKKRLDEKNVSLDLDEIYYPDEIEDLQKTSKLASQILSNFNPYTNLAKAISSSLAFPKLTGALIKPPLGLAVEVIKFEVPSFLKALRVMDNFFVDLSYQFKALHEAINLAVSPLKYLGEMMQSNANAIKSVARIIEEATQPTFIGLGLDLPKNPLFGVLPPLVEDLEEIQEKENQVSTLLPVNLERKETALFIHRGNVFMVRAGNNGSPSFNEVTDKQQIRDLLIDATGEQQLLIPENLQKTSSTQITVESIHVKQIDDNKRESVITVDGLGSSSVIRSKSAWLRVFNAYLQNSGIMDPKYILIEFNKAKTGKYFLNTSRMEKDVTHVPNINDQIKKGLRRCFPELENIISFQKVESDLYNEGRYQLKVDATSSSTFLN